MGRYFSLKYKDMQISYVFKKTKNMATRMQKSKNIWFKLQRQYLQLMKQKTLLIHLQMPVFIYVH